jgi:zinc transporter ZupT
VAHEVAQEISDYLILTSPLQGGLRPFTALALNFLCGLGAVLGALIVLAAPSYDESAIGLVFAFGGGAYLHIGATESMPKVYLNAQKTHHMLGAMLAFAVGAIAIGLVLIVHEHCSAGGHGHGHGHGHSH